MFFIQPARADDGHGAADGGAAGGGRGARARLLARRVRHEVAVQTEERARRPRDELPGGGVPAHPAHPDGHGAPGTLLFSSVMSFT